VGRITVGKGEVEIDLMPHSASASPYPQMPLPLKAWQKSNEFTVIHRCEEREAGGELQTGACP